MSHEGNDKIIDNERDNSSQITLSKNMVFAITELGIGMVQEIAAETLKRKPSMTVKEFAKVLDEYLENHKNKIDGSTSK